MRSCVGSVCTYVPLMRPFPSSREPSQAVAKPVQSDDDIMNIAMIATGSEGEQKRVDHLACMSLVVADNSPFGAMFFRHGANNCVVLQARGREWGNDGRRRTGKAMWRLSFTPDLE